MGDTIKNERLVRWYLKPLVELVDSVPFPAGVLLHGWGTVYRYLYLNLLEEVLTDDATTWAVVRAIGPRKQIHCSPVFASSEAFG